MKIVIDIDEDLYKSIIGHRCKNRLQQRCDYEDLKNAIEDGTSLPKGHGRLIDADALWKKWVFDAIGKQEIDDAPTIIEADTESEVEE